MTSGRKCLIMNCSECGETMQWRCTNQETGVAKYKCPICGNVQLGEDDWKEPIVEVRHIKNYYQNKNRFIVRIDFIIIKVNDI